MKTRKEIIDLLPIGFSGCEIGIFEGAFSNYIIEKKNPRKYYMVDVFEGMAVSGDKDGNNMKTISLEQSYRSLSEKYKNNKQIIIYKGISDLFFQQIESNSLDFAYIDGDHGYHAVRRDLENARDKVKPNGIISGHDYTERFPGVMLAVDDFLSQYSLNMLVTEDGCPSYIINNKKC